ncbi:hypothetical protein [Tsuneonella amylolytica]|uniref:hypothetical protein n=1 Tax=Tsuneonella amylolytica TaxID=2338327 RepID=UPI000EA93656|nr:hypothetical protein [Tsuneonella amylolytica]
MTAEEVLVRARAALSDPAERERQARRQVPACPPPKEGEEIVVCAERPFDPAGAGFDRERAEREYAAKTVNRGNPRAPNLAPPACGPGLLCFSFGTGGPLHRPLIIDLAAIPEAPEDSDAARIGRGEKAR